MQMKKRCRLSNIESDAMLLYQILISITVILVVFWIWNYVTNVYTAVFVSVGLVLAVGAYLLKERESDD